jgi:D-psicose/D-tagatose/L-ribulose 3-epimerase
MEIGVSAFAWTAGFRESHLEILPRLREYGISSFEIPMFDPEKLPAAKIRRAMDDNGLACSVCAILPPGINPIDADSAVRKRSIAHLIKCLDVAAEMGATLIGGPVYAPIGYFSGRRRTAEEWKWATDALQQLTSTLDSNRLDLSIEPVNRSETYFLTTVQDATGLCNAIDYSRIGVTIDTFHANIEEKDIPQAVRFAGKRLKHVHASENDRGLLGSGHVDFPGIINSLHEIGYTGSLMIEGFGYSADEKEAPGALWADVNVTPEDIAFAGAKYLRSIY